MSEDGRGMNELMAQVLRLYRETQALLVSADDLMTDKSWASVNNTCITGSNSLDQPEQWFAQTAHRFYRHSGPERSGILSYVSVLLFDSDKPDLLAEPLLTAGWMDYGSDGDLDNYDYWYSRFHIWMPDPSDDGVARSVGSNNWPKWKLPFEKISTLAVPLVEVTTTDTLNERIVTPLLADIGSSTRS